jgi:hypothetical protein
VTQAVTCENVDRHLDGPRWRSSPSELLVSVLVSIARRQVPASRFGGDI